LLSVAALYQFASGLLAVETVLWIAAIVSLRRIFRRRKRSRRTGNYIIG
jgi:hypothetical protein